MGGGASRHGGGGARTPAGDESCEILTVERRIVDLTRQDPVVALDGEARPQAVFIAAAKVGGISPTTTTPPSSSTKT